MSPTRTQAAPRIEPRDREALDERGWLLIGDVRSRGACERTLSALGRLRPQYGNVLRHEVRFRPGFDDLQYSQSANPITPHTEAPADDPPPRYLALHCHRQARCGGGSTVLADGRGFVRSLPDEVRAELGRRRIRFDLAAEKGRAAPVLSEAANGSPILRFSYNVMRDGRLEGPPREGDDLEGMDPFLAELCRRSVEFTKSHGIPVLAPDHSLLVFDNWRMLHSRTGFNDRGRHLTRYWVG